ncbi:hypothetical protein B0H65DRAFT_154229 [Neurospora tetraspora]|uniref:F-box domain-containing protein n=1 Tax=Neurospora tetraspora TaxID=94610 RepID=A0AAE0JH05_9PEZI|nr:hypothetical protein B0H65DRAFT_154229 [Neurospora tetraspora]
MPKIINLPTEVLGLIVVELSLEHDRDLDYNFRERNKIRRKHLAQLAGTCRRFYDIVKPILWRRHWKEALVSSIKFARHDIIDFLADNRSTLVLEGLDAGANCFDYHFNDKDHNPTVDYCDDESLALSEKKNGNKKPVYPAIIVATMHAYPNPDTAATAIHLIKKGMANPYVPSRNCCKCLSPPARHINGSSGWQSMLHTILCPESSSLEYAAFLGRYGIVHYMLRDIKDFDLTQAYWGPCLLSQLILRSTPNNGAREHLSDIIDLLVTRYGLDVNGGPSSERGITSRPLHLAIWNELLHNFRHSHSYYDNSYNLDTISHLFRLGADPSLAAPNFGPDRRHPPGSTLRPVTAMGAFLLVWTERRINPKHEPWNWRPMADLLVSNGARCHFDRNWESPGLFDFEYLESSRDSSI